MQKLVCCIISIDKLFSENGNVLVVWVTCALAISRYLGSKRKKIILNFGNSNLVAWLSLRTNKLRSSSPIAFVSEGIKNFLNTLTVWSAVVYRIRPVTWCGIFEKFCARTSAEAVWGVYHKLYDLLDLTDVQICIPSDFEFDSGDYSYMHCLKKTNHRKV